MEDSFDISLRAITRKVAERAPKEEILTDARKLKIDLSQYAVELQVTLNTLDQLVSKFARDDDWVSGWWTPEQATVATASTTVSGPHFRRYDRARRTLEVAAGLGEGSVTVLVSDIAGALRLEGEELDDRALATSVGNLLTRSGKWTRIGPGEYAPLSSNGASEQPPS